MIFTPLRKIWLDQKRFERQEDVLAFDVTGGLQEPEVQQFHSLFVDNGLEPPLTQLRFQRPDTVLGLDNPGGNNYPPYNLFLRPTFTEPYVPPVLLGAFSSGFSAGFA